MHMYIYIYTYIRYVTNVNTYMITHVHTLLQGMQYLLADFIEVCAVSGQEICKY